MLNLKNSRGEVMPPIRFRDATGLTADNISNDIKIAASQQSVPANVWVDSVKSGGLLGSAYPCVMISHPNPPTEYFKIMIVINGDTLSFQYMGNSKNNVKSNKQEMYRNDHSLKGLIKSAIVRTDEMAMQQEGNWYADIMQIINSMCE